MGNGEILENLGENNDHLEKIGKAQGKFEVNQANLRKTIGKLGKNY